PEVKPADLGVRHGRPGVPLPPAVRAGLKRKRLRHLERPLVFEEIGEPRSLNRIAKILGGGTVERDRPQAIARLRAPAPVVPGADNKVVLVLRVETLQRLVNSQRTIKIFLVP